MNKILQNKTSLFVTCAVLVVGIMSVFFIKAYYSSTMVQATSEQKTPLPHETTVSLSTNGFSPNNVTIQVGTAVRWINTSGKSETVNSDNYPTNQLHKELNFGVFANGSSVVYTFTTTGTYGYHNQFHPEQKGTITVTQ